MNKRWVCVISTTVWLSVTVLCADDKGDLSTRTREFHEFEEKLNKIEDSAAMLVSAIKDIRAFDEEQMKTLINEMCALDIAKRGDRSYAIAEDMIEKVQAKVKDRHDEVVKEAERLKTAASYYQDQFEDLLENIERLTRSDEVKDEAKKLYEKAGASWIIAKKIFEELNKQQDAISRLRDGTMLGANNPLIRARMIHGIDMHSKLQTEFRCDKTEHPAGGGYADCVVLKGCFVYEFKPSGYPPGDAQSQVDRYVPDIQKEFKDDPLVKECKQDGNGLPKFTATVVTYPRCTP